MKADRRSLLTLLAAPALSPFLAPAASAAQARSLADPLRLGVEQALVDSGLASQFQRSFGRDTGVVVQIVPGSSASVLGALERGEIDASMTNAPEQEAVLLKQGLAHDPQLIAEGDFVLVGPVKGAGRKAMDPAGVVGSHDIVTALTRIAETQTRVIGPVNGSGAHLATQALWRAAKVAPVAPWYTDATAHAIDEAAAAEAYTLVERSVWMAHVRKPLAIVVEGDPLMISQVHLMRSFRASHAAGKFFGKWVTGPQGRRVANGIRGWHAPKR